MATQAQIDANRENAQLSTGPTSEPGKLASSRNSTTHGLSGKAIPIGDEQREEALRLYNHWLDQLRPPPGGLAALEQMVAMKLRIDQCQATLDALFVAQTAEATLDWDGLRRREAAVLAEGLARRPESVAARLQETRQGAELLLERWAYLAGTVERGMWDESARESGLDLLGVPRHLRDPGRTPLDPRDGRGFEAIRATIDEEITRLNSMIANVLIATDDLARTQAAASRHVLLGRQARLILRYEREAHRRLMSAQAAILGGPRGEWAPAALAPADVTPPAPLVPDFEGPPIRVGLVADDDRLPSPPPDPELEELRAIGRRRFAEMIELSKAERGCATEGAKPVAAAGKPAAPAPARPRRRRTARARPGG